MVDSIVQVFYIPIYDLSVLSVTWCMSSDSSGFLNHLDISVSPCFVYFSAPLSAVDTCHGYASLMF